MNRKRIHMYPAIRLSLFLILFGGLVFHNGLCLSQSLDLKTFSELDLNEDGFLSGNEIGPYGKLDADGNGRITPAEFAKQSNAANPGGKAVNPAPTRASRPLTDWDRSLRKQLESGSGWVISIGVNDYPKMPLQCCVADARLIASTFERRCGFPSDQILLLTDKETDSNLFPTKANLTARVSEALQKVQPNDTVVIAFSGHGMLLKGKGYLCPLDFDGSKAESSAWPIDELRLLLQNCRAARKLLILDSCHSGGSSGIAVLGESGQEVGAAFKFAQGQITFSSSRSTETSLESREDKQSIFTLSFVRGIEGFADFDQNGIVDSDEIYRHVLTEVPALAREQQISHHQTPVRIIGQDVVGVFALATVRKDLPSSLNSKRIKPGDTTTNSIGMRLVLLPKGIAIKGSPSSEYKRGDDEDACGFMLTKRLQMGTYEVSQREYELVMASNPSYFAKGGSGSAETDGLATERFPVEQVSWNEAVEFCKKLSALHEEQQAGRVYRLPTESEWEFACRANSQTAFSFGEVVEGSQANIKSETPYWYAKSAPSLGRTRTRGSYPPNAFGLCDMHGNVAEWCSDFYGPVHQGVAPDLKKQAKTKEDIALWLEDFSQSLETGKTYSELTNPAGPRQGVTHVVRGGSFNNDGGQARSAARKRQNPEYKHRTIGFRVVCEQRTVSN